MLDEDDEISFFLDFDTEHSSMIKSFLMRFESRLNGFFLGVTLSLTEGVSSLLVNPEVLSPVSFSKSDSSLEYSCFSFIGTQFFYK